MRRATKIERKSKLRRAMRKQTQHVRNKCVEEQASWGNASFDVHCSDVLTDEMITQATEAPASHINRALLKQARAKFIPLSPEDEEGE